MAINIELNQSQRQAVTASEQPVLVLAGPGTGKTRTLIKRIEFLIVEKAYPPSSILAITFTNKAARELKDRLRDTIGEKSEGVVAGTFHSFCLDIIRENHNFFHLPRHFNIADAEYQEAIIRDFISKPNPDYNLVKGTLRGISNHKMQNRAFRSEFVSDAYEYYQNALNSIHAIDFDDIIKLTQSLFAFKKDVLSYWQGKFRAILVDEFQDTDELQYNIIRELAEKHKNIFVVADDDQSIFAWRGANPGNIEKYLNDFRIDIEDIRVLNKNYRTTPDIYKMALKPLLKTSRIYPDKNIEVVKKDSKPVTIKNFPDRIGEGKYIADKIKTWVTEEHIDYSDIAIIYPRHVIGQQLEKELLKEKIPSRLASGKSLLAHPAVQKVLAFLRFALNTKDTIAFKKIFELYLPSATFKKIEHLSFRYNRNFRMALTKALLLPDYSSFETREIKIILGKISNIISNTKNASLHFLITKILAGDEKHNLFYLKKYINELCDPSKDFPENSDTIRMMVQAIARNVQIVINTGNPKVDLIFRDLFYRLIGNVKVATFKMYQKQCKREASDNAFIISSDQNAVPVDFPVKPNCKLTNIAITSAKSSFPADELVFRTKLTTISAALFKFLQILTTQRSDAKFSNYTIIDLETTDVDVETCDIIEIAAVKVRDNQITEKFQTLVKPGKEISTEAANVHGIDLEMVEDSKPINEIWDIFINFINEDILIAHNGVNFDFRILNRMHKKLKKTKLENIFYDTLPLAREIYQGQTNSIDALAERMDLDPGNRHRALDDVMVLNEIYKRLFLTYSDMLRLSSYEEYLPEVTLAMSFEDRPQSTEEQLLFQIGYAGIKYKPPGILRQLEKYTDKVGADIINKVTKISESQSPMISGEQSSREKLTELMLLGLEYEHQFEEINEAISQFIQFLSLYTDAQTLNEEVNAVNLLTLHTCKGLEFNKVIISGLEDNNMPSYWSYQTDDLDDTPIHKKQEEQRRLFYVGMTRAKDELILTCSKTSDRLREEKPSPFLQELTE